MPSQRLLKMLDPLGHTSQRALESPAPKVPFRIAERFARRSSATAASTRLPAMKVVAYAGTHKVAAWISRELTRELADRKLEVFRATSFRHVSTSLRPGARPMVSLAVLDFDAMSEMDIETLTATRWMGYRGAIIAIARGFIAERVKTLVGIDMIVREGIENALRDAVARL